LALGGGTVHHFLAFRRQNGAKRLKNVGFFRRLGAVLTGEAKLRTAGLRAYVLTGDIV
jgi:hypothetical protein